MAHRFYDVWLVRRTYSCMRTLVAEKSDTVGLNGIEHVLVRRGDGAAQATWNWVSWGRIPICSLDRREAAKNADKLARTTAQAVGIKPPHEARPSQFSEGHGVFGMPRRCVVSVEANLQTSVF